MKTQHVNVLFMDCVYVSGPDAGGHYKIWIEGPSIDGEVRHVYMTKVQMERFGRAINEVLS